MTDDVTEAGFPDTPEAPTYTKLQPSQRKQMLDQQIQQFEQEMAAHFSNWNRLRATYDAAPAGDEGEEIRESCRTEANNAATAIQTIKIAIAATNAERAAL